MLVDFTSMYPSVDALMNLWPYLTHQTLTTDDGPEVTAGVQGWLDTLTLEDCFRPETWPALVGLAQAVPDGDVLPVRSTYGTGQAWNIGVNHLHSREPLWFTLADLAASTLLSGKPPRVLRAVRFTPSGPPSPTLQAVRLRGEVPVHPGGADFFRTVVEERHRLKASAAGHSSGCGCEPCRLAAFLKVLANSGSYGIYVEMHRQRTRRGERAPVMVHGTREQAWAADVSHPEVPGEFCFPPVAACITGAGRLLLAMLERCVTDAGGAWAFCDTDSMAIVAQEGGGLIPCDGGPHHTPTGVAAVRALTPDQVASIRARFDALNPYAEGTAPTLLKEESTAWCVAISAKRYALYEPDAGGGVARVVKHSEHGLGHLLNPTDPDAAERDWIRHLWEIVIMDALGRPAPNPGWLDRPTLTRITVSSADMLHPFAAHNAGRPYAEQIKPGNFLLAAQVAPFGHPAGVNEGAFKLLAPYETDPAHWGRLAWRNLHDPAGPAYRITTDGFDPNTREDDTARVKTYRTVLAEYRQHPEPKAAAPDGQPCRPDTAGWLARRTLHAHTVHHIGKEANDLEKVRAGLVARLDDVQTDYTPDHPTWTALVLPVLATATATSIARALTAAGTPVSNSNIPHLLKGRTTPRPALREALTRHAVTLATAHTHTTPTPGEHGWQAVLAHWADHYQPPAPDPCPCGCTTPLRPRQRYASPTCRQRHRTRQRTTQNPHHTLNRKDTTP